MPVNLYKNHRLFVSIIALVYFALSVLIAVQPAWSVQENNAPLPGSQPQNGEVEAGLRVFVAEGCVGCHTQQVRNIDMDKTWGGRPGIPADYAWRTRLDNLRAPGLRAGDRTNGSRFN